MKTTLSIFLAIAAVTCFAQEEKWVEPSAKTQKYEEYRWTPTEPVYGLKKVKALISKVKKDGDDQGKALLDRKSYDALTLKEKFTYTMLHGEYFSQNCDAVPPMLDSEKKIRAYPADPFSTEVMWSDRQREFLKKNRAEVIGLLRDTIHTKGRVGANLKEAILEIKATELIPDMIRVYNKDHKDHDILSTLMVMMRVDKYKPFTGSPLFKKLYGDEDASYKSFVMATSANQKLIISQANRFYQSRKK